ncbi:hypothetical protein BH10CYA1_BH10CYA1_53860 [soil metagenome]
MNFPRLFLLAIAFLIIFPAPVFGIYIHGGLLTAFLLACVYSILLHIIWTLLEVSWFLTFGLSLVATLLFFWLVPALVLLAMGWLLPAYITVSSLLGAVLAGLVVMVINKLTA